MANTGIIHYFKRPVPLSSAAFHADNTKGPGV